MTAPRQVLPGATYAVSRRCTQRQYLLRPSRVTNVVFLYALAVASRRFGIRVHAFCVMSNHFHLLLTDPCALLPAFHQYMDALVARAMNASLGRWESFWAPGSYSAVRLVSPPDIVDKTAYALANPVAAGLVRTGRLWPGAWSDPDRFGSTIEVERPVKFFSARGTMPEKALLKLTVPPGFTSAAEFRGQVGAAIADQEREAQRRVRRGFLGVDRVLKQSPFGRPASVEPRRNLNPRIAAREAWKRVDALLGHKEFVRAYRDALARRRAGQCGVVFPAGTYLLRVAHGVPCAGSG